MVKSLIYREHKLSYAGFELLVNIKEQNPLRHAIKTRITHDKNSKDAYRAIMNFFNEIHWFNDVEISGIDSGCEGEYFMSYCYTVDNNEYLIRKFEQKVFEESQHLALAFYREGMSVISPYYRLLCLYKILEIPFKEDIEVNQWIDDEIKNIKHDFVQMSLKKIEGKLTDDVKTVSHHIKKFYRNQASHAKIRKNRMKNVIDYNDYESWERIKWINVLLEELAKRVIIKILAVERSEYNRIDCNI